MTGKKPGPAVGAGLQVPRMTGRHSPAQAGTKPSAQRGGAGAAHTSVRLDRLLAREGLGSRSEVKKAVCAGKAVVNGIPERDPGRQVFPSDEVFFDGKKVGQETFVYYMLHKPAGVLTATRDRHAQTVLDLLRETGPAPVLRQGLFPVGRLDRDTEGLLLITDDGQLAHALLSPKKHVDKTYYALVTGRVTEEEIRRFSEGIRVPGEGGDEAFTAMPAKLQTDTAAAFADLLPADPGQFVPGKITEYTQTLVTIQEGRFHQVRRMFSATGKKVLYLKRLSMGPLRLDPGLAPGEYRPLTNKETELLIALAGSRSGGVLNEKESL